MKFEVKKDGVIKFHTNQESCVPATDIIKLMKKAGYKVLKDGKVVKV